MASYDRQFWRAKTQKSKGQFYAGPIFPAGPHTYFPGNQLHSLRALGTKRDCMTTSPNWLTR